MSERVSEGCTRTFETENGVISYEIIEPTGPSATRPADPSTTTPTTLTLLHNFMSTGRAAWGPMLTKFAENYRILLPDLPGHGKSIGHPTNFHYGKMAEQLAALLVHEQATNGHLAGCSAGGMIAQLLVQNTNLAPQTLTLVSTTYSVNEAVTGAKHELKPENFRAGRRWKEATAKLHDPHHHSGYYEEILLPAFRQLDPSRAIDLSLAEVAQWQMPVCIIHGAEDEFFPIPIVEQMSAALTDVTTHIIEGQPHALIFRRPWRVQELMTTFLDKF